MISKNVSKPTKNVDLTELLKLLAFVFIASLVIGPKGHAKAAELSEEQLNEMSR
ncbi:hypothetical protein [Agarivorans sp. 1_MG-2023]|uniref:hypothetical protein n=1 Tax=Agarivorans sp. 1_MG-2023 TaxID=3062634 RepID=UPI0026E16D34|nr:hypothetical protein [Agarivorans sp. 1_MG-2023]MDO6762600.1 hypothetical protein [Agarivorans sp. 1_MG-2023]